MKRGAFLPVTLVVLLNLSLGTVPIAASGKKSEKSKTTLSDKDRQEIDKAWEELQKKNPALWDTARQLQLDRKVLGEDAYNKLRLKLIQEEHAKKQPFMHNGIMVVPVERHEIQRPTQKNLGDWHLHWPPKGQPAMPRLDRPVDPR